ncbi:MAG: carboxypeptidase-like regulatory domain-containing protein, partial [Thermofilaceae archaeon]
MGHKLGLEKLTLLTVFMLISCVAAQPVALTSGDTPLSGAIVDVEKLDGTRLRLTAGPDGTVTVMEVPLGILKVKVVSWKNVPVNYECVTTPENRTITVKGINRVVVTVTGSRGQGLPGALVKVFYGGLEVESGLTDDSGVYRTLLPSASYVIRVEYNGAATERSVELRDYLEVKIPLDVFTVIGNYPISS